MFEMKRIPMKLLDENAKFPTVANDGDAGMDLYACYHEYQSNTGEPIKMYNNVMIRPKEAVMIGLGIAMAIPQGYFGAIYARSGLASKQGLRPATCTSVVDSGYRGEVKVYLYNDSDRTRTIQMGDRIAQMVIQPCVKVDIIPSDDLSETERGEGGFGSTGY